MNALIRRVAGHSVTHVLFAFVGMGSWAVFSNRAHPMPEPVVAGVVQGTLSACLTLTLKTIIDRLAARFSGSKRLWLPPLIASSVSACVLLAIHKASGTPEILATISLPMTVATSYAVIYNYSRQTARRP
ncbi:hypothetical protein [Pelagibius sp. Alg239-R121]|uniref:hypothetical protein n=1 Tax=Pelagibius sp. Alg239-R121 TaxID=2993448 RepID=UPI0024A62B8D|nr:hypothetical protein [Pelagibius sp. Alg239-R121]